MTSHLPFPRLLDLPASPVMCNHPSIDYYRRAQWFIRPGERSASEKRFEPCLNAHDAPPPLHLCPANWARNTKTDHERASLPRYVAAVKVKPIVKFNGLWFDSRFSSKVQLYFDPFASVKLIILLHRLFPLYWNLITCIWFDLWVEKWIFVI